MTNPVEEYCERCGEHRPGARKWMFYGTLSRLPNLPIAREFFCFPCIRIMRIYRIIGIVLAVVAIAAIVAATMWVNSLAGP